MTSRALSPAPAPLIEVARASLGYGQRRVLSDLSFSIHAGDFVGIVGPNGSGKTTLLRSLLGLLPPLAGRVTWNAPEGRRGVGYVPQRQALDPVFPLRAIDVVLMGLYGAIGPARRPASRHVAAADRALERAAISPLRDRAFRDLSGGEKQRVLIARALASSPCVLLLDEPTNDMDLAGENSIMEFLLDLNRNEGTTVVMVSHLLNVVANYASRIVLIAGGTVRLGSVEEILTDASLGRIYGIPVSVKVVDGRWIVFPGGTASVSLGDFFYPFEFFSRNYLATVVLAAGCAYVGLFVLLRRIVFVGVALAEFSVLGIAAAFLVLTFLGPGVVYDALRVFGPTAGALAFALLGVVLLTFATTGKRLPRDGIIGFYFAAASAVALLFVWKSAFGKEELVSIVSGSILFVDDARLAVLTLSYLAVAVVHAIFFKEILFVSFDREMARTLGLNASLYDFLLYASLGVLISIGVRIGGVLLVFGYLVIPPIGGLLAADGFAAAARVAWFQALTGSCAGLFLAYRFDYPTGPMIVACLAALAGLSAVAREVRFLRAPLRAGAILLAIPAAASLLVAASNYAAGTHVASEPEPARDSAAEPSPELVEHLIEHDLASPSAGTRAHAVEHLSEHADPRALAAIRGAIADPDATVAQLAMASAAARGDRAAVANVEALARRGGVPSDVRLAAGDALEALGSTAALDVFVSLLGAEGEAVVRSDALDRVRRILGDDFGYESGREPGENRDAILRIGEAASRAAPDLDWDPETRTLRVRKN